MHTNILWNEMLSLYLDKHSVYIWETALSHIIICLAPSVGKINQIVRCEWLPEWARCSYLARWGLPTVSHEKDFPESQIIINPALTKLFRSRWLDIGQVLVFENLWTLTPSWSINTQKKNNIQPS